MLEIKVLGTGCPNCNKLEQMCHEIIAEIGIEANIEKISDLEQITSMGVMLTPALIIDNKLMVQGKLPLKSTLKHWIERR